MPKLVNATPKYRLHRRSGQAVVTLNGHDHYLGPWKSKTSKLEYDRLTGERLANGRRPPAALSDLTVMELISRYWDFARTYYVKHGRATDEQAGIRIALRYLKEGYGHTFACEFGPRALAAIQSQLVSAGLSRKYCNETLARIKRCFKWGVRCELVPVTVLQSLLTVPGLRRGKTTAVDHPPVRPVPMEMFEATVCHAPRGLADLLRLQLLSGMRPGEVCSLRPGDVDTSGDVWVYIPREHKMEHAGRQRRIWIGPKGQEVLRPYLLRGPDEHCFLTPRARRPYTTNSLFQAVRRACDAAFRLPERLSDEEKLLWRTQHRWHPNQLRHSAATECRKRFGLESTQVYVGHARADVTQIYAERDYALAQNVARQFG
jgi:integrase